METIRATTAQALVHFLIAQKTEIDGEVHPLVPGVFAIFGHGNVTCLGEALEPVQDQLPTWRGHNEQSMALAAIAFAKARRRRQVMVATTSIGPGALNMVTAAGVAMANRLPVFLLSGDTFVSRVPDPVLQQVEVFGDPSLTVNDAFKPVVRYWDRIVHPAQLLQSLPQAVATLVDPAVCGPVFIALPQDVQAEAFDWPASFFAERVHNLRRPAPDPVEVEQAAMVLRASLRPLIIAGGGVRYSAAEERLVSFAQSHRIPVAETVAGKGSLAGDDPANVGPIGVTGSTSANAMAAEADLVLAVGTRLQDFTTGSWSVFRNDDMRLVTINVGRFDATKHLATSVVGDAAVSLDALDSSLGAWTSETGWFDRAAEVMSEWNSYLTEVTEPGAETPSGLPSYAQVIGSINNLTGADDYVVAAAGGLPGELNKVWRSHGPATFDCEYGFSCMSYEIAGAWGAAMASPAGEVVSFCGDGSYLMANSDVFSSVLSGHKMIVILCDNGGYAVIQRLQEFKGSAPFNNRYDEGTRRAREVEVDYAAHARALGAEVEEVETLDELPAAFERARANDRTTVIVIRTDPTTWTEGDAWWDVGVPEISEREQVRVAKAAHEAERKHQRTGV
jgi:3D-(3,5/4)-trihydroxycyclohexane-1,2-dione acylhydrolase (decyclizing)